MNNELKSVFNKILSNNIFPYFKKLNYKKKGNNFRFYDKIEQIGKIVNFQKSQYDENGFVINIGIYIPEFEYYHYDIPKISNEKFTEPICAIRGRRGFPENGDRWYELNAETNMDNLKNELESDVKNNILPFLNGFNDKESVFKQLFTERYSGWYEVTRMKVLYKNRFKNEIIEIIKSEEYQRKYKGIVFDKINNWIKENE